MFRLWPAALPDSLEMLAVQTPGRGSRFHEPAIEDMASLVAQLVPAIEPHLDRPYALFGHSMGAVIAAEVARTLSAKGHPEPVLLAVFGPGAPGGPGDLSLPHVGGDAAVGGGSGRPDGGNPKEVLDNPDVLALLLPALRADVKALETYRPAAHRQPLGCAIAAFGGHSDRLADRRDLEAWRAQTLGSFHLHQFPGGHFYLDAQRRALLTELTRLLSPFLLVQGEASHG